MKPIKTLAGPAAALPFANVDTDQIIPARFMSRSRADGYGDQCFHDMRFDQDGAARAGFPLNALPEGPTVLVADDNFGCGSSREAAVYALLDYGVSAVIAPSFADIFRSNSGKNGLLTIALPPATVQALLAKLAEAPGTPAQVDLPAQRVTIGNEAFDFEIDPRLKHRLENGLDDLSATLQDADQIEAFEASYFGARPWIRPRKAG
ncbi:3-isopropylmalate dehydratase small subunit [Maritimibacter alkaliphilus]|uniref:3-isopropylmalate dehydratase small subunit n=1 Tax=Maritimibacter alkaliphilus TaxID=404236 RepID=UPI001C9673F6|nr:3-isopropylmalate dehydratase small subunit [Maritimibacter alkaliphilus]MBY6089290.1 3-isopropylmalate dehydratase small subunit [Maritimibacter alkaliphilus]